MQESLPGAPVAMPAPTPDMPPAVQRRIPIAAAHATENTARIAARMDRQASLLNVLLRQCQTPAASRCERLARLRRLADAWAAIVAPDAACGPSCAHCCHIPVPVTRIEAEDLARAAKRPPATIDGTALPPIQAGYHLPCPFLRNRPLQRLRLEALGLSTALQPRRGCAALRTGAEYLGPRALCRRAATALSIRGRARARRRRRYTKLVPRLSG
ncbi:hypothetical protein HBIAX_04473 [Achromobacter xylosoxidans]|nr:hypothetical protein HBIAX_04473 [Achromobacter xylosoxidans]